MADSIWQSEWMKEPEEGFFIKFVEGVPRTLKWLNVEWQEQKANAQFPTEDGKQLLLTFEEKGQKKGFTANNMKNRLITSMKGNGVEIGDTFVATRHGEKTMTTYEVEKIGGSAPQVGGVIAPEGELINEKDLPF